jgi:hypothetical protein
VILLVTLGLLLLVTPAAQAARAVAVDLPAGEYVHAGAYFPVLVTLQESAQPTDAEVQVSVGSLTFSRRVSMSPGTTRRLIVRVAAFEEHPEIVVEVRSGGRRWRYPQLARALMEKLRVLPGREHLVGILSASPSPELTQLFKWPGVTRVQIRPRSDFPEDMFRVFDLIAFEGFLWNMLNKPVRDAVDAYVKSGGKVYISGKEQIPIRVPEAQDTGVLFHSARGLGTFFALNPNYNLRRGVPGAKDLKELILSELGLARPRQAQSSRPSEMAQAFEPLPRYLDWRASWALYLIVCSLTLCAAGLCSLLRLWTRKFAAASLPVLALGLAAGFAAVVPSGDMAYERISVFLTAAGSDTAIHRSYLQLYSFAVSAEEPRLLGARGLILPAASGWGGCGGCALILHNGNDARVSGLRLKKGRAAVFEVSRRFVLDGSFHAKTRSDKIYLTNNSGFDLQDCVLVSSGKVTRLGAFRFGQTVDLNPDAGEFVQEYMRRRFDAGTREGRVVAAFTECCWKKYLKPKIMYLVGWADGGPPPSGYAQAGVYAAMWIVQVKAGS